MKINLTLEVCDDLRRLMGTAPECAKTQDGLATREEVIHFLRAKLVVWSVLAEGFSLPSPITEHEKDEYESAITHLQACGWDSTQIKRWIFKQRARHDFLNAKLS
jgi:hypothetical protein